jgi:nuclear transport factor 2 (NTF2) superfamily protein
MLRPKLYCRKKGADFWVIGSVPMATKTGNSMSKGSLVRRLASINDLPIQANDRKFFWPLGRRPEDHPGLSELGL